MKQMNKIAGVVLIEHSVTLEFQNSISAMAMFLAYSKAYKQAKYKINLKFNIEGEE